jgi:hypothetical protein
LPTLGADYEDIQSELGFHLGFGRDISAFSAEDLASIVAWIKGGLQRMLFSAFQPKLDNTYDWSFLQQTFRFGTQIGQTEYDLPANFGSTNGPILWDSPTLAYRPIEWMNESFIRAKLSLTSTYQGIPLQAATFSKNTDGSAEQVQALVLYPRPDATYPFRMSFSIEPGMLTTQFPWPAGGSPHARTLLYACLAEATKRHDDNASYEADYQIALAGSINYDARSKGDNLGYCGDPKNRENPRWWPWNHEDDQQPFTDLRVTVGGVQY